MHLTDFMIPASLLCGAVVAILRPITFLRWAKQAHPDLPENDTRMLWIVRFIGAGGLGITVYAIVLLVRGFSAR
jgi:hypothetical protein